MRINITDIPSTEFITIFKMLIALLYSSPAQILPVNFIQKKSNLPWIIFKQRRRSHVKVDEELNKSFGAKASKLCPWFVDEQRAKALNLWFVDETFRPIEELTDILMT